MQTQEFVPTNSKCDACGDRAIKSLAGLLVCRACYGGIKSSNDVAGCISDLRRALLSR